jgi:hypothetical protein
MKRPSCAKKGLPTRARDLCTSHGRMRDAIPTRSLTRLAKRTLTRQKMSSPATRRPWLREESYAKHWVLHVQQREIGGRFDPQPTSTQLLQAGIVGDIRF